MNNNPVSHLTEYDMSIINSSIKKEIDKIEVKLSQLIDEKIEKTAESRQIELVKSIILKKVKNSVSRQMMLNALEK